MAISPVCPKCGAIAKSGETSCCSRGGSWFKTCGGFGNARYHHTWYEGIQACKARPQSRTIVGSQANAAQPADVRGDGTVYSKGVIAANLSLLKSDKTSVFPTSRLANMSNANAESDIMSNQVSSTPSASASSTTQGYGVIINALVNLFSISLVGLTI